MGFDFTIALVPETTSLDREMQYIKSALLYADSVTLISPLAHIFYQLTDESHQKNNRSALQLFQQVMSFIKVTNASVYANVKPNLDQFTNILLSPQFRALPYSERLLISRQLRDFVLSISDSIYQLIGENQCKELSTLIKNKQVKIAPFNHIMDDTNAGIKEYFAHLNLSLRDSYPLYDKFSSDLMYEAVQNKVIRLSVTEQRKIAHAGMADNILQRLPSFESSSVDEIIDIKKELSSPLIRFRSKMLDYSDSLQTLPWDKDFENECNLLYDKKVVPALLEIEESTKENSFIKNLGNRCLTDENTWKSVGGMVVGVAAAGVIASFNEVISADTSMLVAGSAMIASKITASYSDYLKKKKEIEKKDLYFYYQAGKNL